MKEYFMKSRKRFLIAGFGLAVIVIYFVIVTLIHRTTYEESSKHLDELSRQMAASIEKQSRSQWNMMDMFYRYFLDVADGDWELLRRLAEDKKKDWGFDSLCLVDKNAVYYDRNTSYSLLSREEITSDLLTERKPVILDNMLITEGGRLIFLAPIDPFVIDNKEFSAIGVSYNSQNLFDILDIHAFDGKALLYITHQDGVVLFRTDQEGSITGYNLFNSLGNAEFGSESLDMLRNNIRSGRQELMTVHWGDEEYYLNHTPVGVYDWQLITMVPVSVVSGGMIRSSIVIFVCVFLSGVLVVAAFILVYTDSAKKVLRAEETARKAAENASLAKSQFLSNMSHDIRTPMNAIIGMTKIAADNIHEPDKVSDCLKKIDLSGRLLVGLINDILDMSKIESGKMNLNNDTASLVELMQQLVGITQPTVRQKKQVFHIRLHNIRHEILIFDALRLNQVMINLLGNALKFTPEGGSISVDLTEVPTEDGKNAHFIFKVADTGIGISREFQENLFTSFSRERDGRIDKIEGSGLGLAITKTIVTMMGGSIAVESEPGKGSIFTVELDFPIAKEPEEMKLPSMRVLLADDDPDTCKSASEYLKELGVSADTALGGRQAVRMAGEAAARGEGYHMIFLDWRMPDLEGTYTARKIRELVGGEVPILIISAYDWSGIELEASEAGIDGFIQKPFFKSTLYHNIRKYYLHCEEDRQAENTERMDLSGRKFLLVDDNEINLEIMQVFLSQTGAAVETACNGQEAVERFANSPIGYYSIIFMDIQMPIMNGYDAVRAIRKMEREDARGVPVFAMTADAFADDIEMAKSAGMNVHLAKPLNMAAVIREMKKYLK